MQKWPAAVIIIRRAHTSINATVNDAGNSPTICIIEINPGACSFLRAAIVHDGILGKIPKERAGGEGGFSSRCPLSGNKR